MMNYEVGILLICSYEGCGCWVCIEVLCYCVGVGDVYCCICGDELVLVKQIYYVGCGYGFCWVGLLLFEFMVGQFDFGCQFQCYC